MRRSLRSVGNDNPNTELYGEEEPEYQINIEFSNNPMKRTRKRKTKSGSGTRERVAGLSKRKKKGKVIKMNDKNRSPSKKQSPTK